MYTLISGLSPISPLCFLLFPWKLRSSLKAPYSKHWLPFAFLEAGMYLYGNESTIDLDETTTPVELEAGLTSSWDLG